MRRTRIVATIGPASDSDETLKELVAAGVDVLRLSFAHGDIPSGIERLRRVRRVAPELAIMVDIPGPKIRAGSFGSSPIELNVGHEVEMVEGFGEISDADRITVERLDVLKLLKVGDSVHLGDGGVSLEIVAIAGRVLAKVTSGGTVMGKPGVSLPSSIMNDRLPTVEDRARLEALRDEEFEILAVSFVRSGFDIESVRAVLSRDDVMIMAKVETAEAVGNLEEIIVHADAIMVARGDLGVRLPIEEVPHLQKRIVHEGIRYARPVVVATQMLESMTHAQVPTRAEVTDVANAVLDGASAVMLSGETAIGVNPPGVVVTMDRILRRAEASFNYQEWGQNLGVQQLTARSSQAMRITAAITGATWRAAMEEGAVAIVACTRSGMTARAISRFRPPMPIIAITPSVATARQLHGSWGVQEIIVSPVNDIDGLCEVAMSELKRLGYARVGDPIVIMAGSASSGVATTDTVRMFVVH